MKNAIKILSIIAMFFSCFALLLSGAILTCLWKPMNILMSTPEIIIEQGSIIPIGNMLYIVCCLLVAVVLFITYKSKRFIVIEIISIVLLGVVFPISTYYLDRIQTIWVGHSMGENALVALGITNSLLFLPLGVINLSLALCLITSGMRITEKFYLKKQYNDKQL